MTMAAVSTASYVRVQATVAAVVNVVVNPAIDWMSGRHKGPQPLWAPDGLVVNFMVTSLILSVLVALFAGFGARREQRTGRLEGSVAAPRWLARLTGRAWLLGLIFGVVAAATAVTASWLLDVAGVSTVSLGWLMTVKAVYCGALGFGVARWVILRQLIS